MGSPLKATEIESNLKGIIGFYNGIPCKGYDNAVFFIGYYRVL